VLKAGSQFTSSAFTGLLMKNEIKNSMDGNGAWRDNVFVERLWRTIKYEEVYLRAYANVSEAHALICRCQTRPNSPSCNQSISCHNDGKNPIKKNPGLLKQIEPPLLVRK
jgi:putative transposase